MHHGAILALGQIVSYMERSHFEIRDLMREFDESGDGLLSHDELLHAIMGIDGSSVSLQQAEQLVRFLDDTGDGEIDSKELAEAIKMYQEKRDEGSLDAWATAGTDIEVDRVFPNWMIARDDFKLVFTRFNGPGAGGGNRANKSADDGSVDSVGAALGVNGQSRSHEDLQLLAQWLKEHSKFIGKLDDKRRVEMCRHLQRVEMEGDEVVFAEGDTGDAFYIVYNGRCIIKRNGRTVAKIEPYNHFGEIALQSNAPRNATVMTDGPCVLVKLTAFHYELCMRHCGTQRAKHAYTFFRDICPYTMDWDSLQRWHNLSIQVTWAYFKRDEVVFSLGDYCGGLCFLFEGELSGCRKLRYEDENSWPLERGRKPKRRTRKSTKDVFVKIENFTEGDVFGEDAFFSNESTRRYEVVVTSANATILIASRKISRQYFTKEQQQSIEAERQGLHQEETRVRKHFEKCNSRLSKFEKLRMDSLGPQYKKRLEASKKAAEAEKAKKSRAEAKLLGKGKKPNGSFNSKRGAEGGSVGSRRRRAGGLQGLQRGLERDSAGQPIARSQSTLELEGGRGLPQLRNRAINRVQSESVMEAIRRNLRTPITDPTKIDEVLPAIKHPMVTTVEINVYGEDPFEDNERPNGRPGSPSTDEYVESSGPMSLNMHSSPKEEIVKRLSAVAGISKETRRVSARILENIDGLEEDPQATNDGSGGMEDFLAHRKYLASGRMEERGATEFSTRTTRPSLAIISPKHRTKSFVQKDGEAGVDGDELDHKPVMEDQMLIKLKKRRDSNPLIIRNRSMLGQCLETGVDHYRPTIIYYPPPKQPDIPTTTILSTRWQTACEHDSSRRLTVDALTAGALAVGA
mmetsp:Transcript_5738/g.13324  ORF Transcript_5738/g.13324 Transcript_5738/m.13324 type:complete len:855 (-) Transcript_5738:112-2676(-)